MKKLCFRLRKLVNFTRKIDLTSPLRPKFLNLFVFEVTVSSSARQCKICLWFFVCLFQRQNNNFCLFCDVFPICNFANHFFYWVRKLETSLCVKYRTLRPSLVAQAVKRLPTMRETRVRSLGREDPLEKEMATHSSILARKIPWTEKPGWLLSMGSQRVGHDRVTSLSLSLSYLEKRVGWNVSFLP